MIKPAEILSARILIVDDNRDNVALLEGILEAAGYTGVESTTDPRTVCELYRRNRYSLILLDLQMPYLDGFQVMEGLKEIEGDGYLPVVALTAQPAFKLRALDAGARDFVNKPFDIAELRARVRNALELRLLQQRLRNTVGELESSREVIRLQTVRESSLAQETQESLLPRRLPAFENFHIRAYNSPTHYVGGDFYDFQQLHSGAWTGVLADVSGKGMAAAILSSMVLGALSTGLRAGTLPSEVLNRVNLLLCEKSLPYQFVTLFLFILGPDGAGEFISAGHNTSWLFRAATGKLEPLAAQHHFLGMFESGGFESSPLTLGLGDILVVYSDGLTDAENAAGEMFGDRRVLDILRHQARHGIETLEHALLEAMQSFTQATPQTDDITFVLVERRT